MGIEIIVGIERKKVKKSGRNGEESIGKVVEKKMEKKRNDKNVNMRGKGKYRWIKKVKGDRKI